MFDTQICKDCKTKQWLSKDKCKKCGGELYTPKRINHNKIWNKDENSYSRPEYTILKLPEGGRLDGILDGCTKCPTGNSSCLESFDIMLCGFHPDRGVTEKRILICSFGIEDMESTECAMNK